MAQATRESATQQAEFPLSAGWWPSRLLPHTVIMAGSIAKTWKGIVTVREGLHCLRRQVAHAAKTDFEANWRKWLTWAKLGEMT
jgi:hypothetical protein